MAAITATVTPPDTIIATYANEIYIAPAVVFATGQTTVYATGDNGTYQTGAAHDYSILTTGQYAGTVNIVLNGKTDAHSNACVYDAASKLMWSRTVSASVGPTSNGLLPWTVNVNGEGIFEYAAAANAALLAGYSDWRVPNTNELGGLAKYDIAQNGAMPDNTAFPTVNPTWVIWTSTTFPYGEVEVYALQRQFNFIVCTYWLKTDTSQVLLVRSPL